MPNFRDKKTFIFRHALSVGFSVFVAFIVNNYFSFSNEYWIVLAAFLVSQTTRGTPLRQGMILFITIMSAVFVASLLTANIKRFDEIYIILSALFIGCGYLAFISRPLANKTYFMGMLFPVILLIATLSPANSLEFMQNRLIDVAIGAFIGNLCMLIVLPVKLDIEFSEGVLPVLSSLNEYSRALTESLLGSANSKNKSSEIKTRVENALQSHQGLYPEWVYEVGFNRGLRSGFRFFLVNVERIAEVFFSIDYLISRGMDPFILRDLYGCIENAMEKNQELLSILTEYFENKRISDTRSDFTSDIAELEKALHRVVPDNIEILDISPKYLLITAFVRDMRDLRGLLLQLVMALPATRH